MIFLKTMIGLLILLLSLFAGVAIVQSDKDPSPHFIDEEYDIEVKVHGLHCSMCVRNCERFLEKLDQVGKAVVDLDENVALIQLKPGQSISRSSITEAIENAGFKAGEFTKFPGK